ncbi:hypothetical protein J7L48_05405, partial [bacterium]|nr:hypothetical protein [bacterium]
MGKKKKRKRNKKLVFKKKIQKSEKQIQNEASNKWLRDFYNVNTTEEKINFLEKMLNCQINYDKICYLEALQKIEDGLGKERKYNKAEEVILYLIKKKDGVFNELYPEITRDLIMLNTLMNKWEKVEYYLEDFATN